MNDERFIHAEHSNLDYGKTLVLSFAAAANLLSDMEQILDDQELSSLLSKIKILPDFDEYDPD